MGTAEGLAREEETLLQEGEYLPLPQRHEAGHLLSPEDGTSRGTSRSWVPALPASDYWACVPGKMSQLQQDGPLLTM